MVMDAGSMSEFRFSSVIFYVADREPHASIVNVIAKAIATVAGDKVEGHAATIFFMFGNDDPGRDKVATFFKKIAGAGAKAFVTFVEAGIEPHQASTIGAFDVYILRVNPGDDPVPLDVLVEQTVECLNKTIAEKIDGPLVEAITEMAISGCLGKFPASVTMPKWVDLVKHLEGVEYNDVRVMPASKFIEYVTGKLAAGYVAIYSNDPGIVKDIATMAGVPLARPRPYMFVKGKEDMIFVVKLLTGVDAPNLVAIGIDTTGEIPVYDVIGDDINLTLVAEKMYALACQWFDEKEKDNGG